MGLRDIRTMNFTEGQKIESDTVMKRLGDLAYRNLGTFAKAFLFDTGKALVVGEGLRVEPSSLMTVNVPSGSVFQRVIDVIPCLQTEAQTVTIDAATGSPRTDIVEGQIIIATDKDDVVQTGAVVTGTSISVTNTSIKRDIKYYLSVRKQTGTTAPTVATPAVLTGVVAIPGTIDLTNEYLINLSDGEDGSYQEIDCRGGTPSATTRAEIISAINSAVGRTMASTGGGNVIVLTGIGAGQESYFEIKPPTTDTDKDALQVIFGVSIGGTYRYTYQGTNEWFKLAEIDVGASTTTITSGLIRNVNQKDSWADGADMLLSGFLINTDYTTITVDSTLVNNTKNLINASSKLELLLPVYAQVGDKININDIGSGGYKILQNASQNILWRNQSTVPGVTGYIESKTGFSSIELICIVASTTWQAVNINDEAIMKGYIMGGIINGPETAVIEDLTFSTEASVPITATLDTAKRYGTGVSSNLKGYIMGGDDGSATAVIEDLTFNTEASVVITATLNTAKYGGAGVSSNLKGYCMGGYTGSYLAVIEDLNFSAETSVPITATLDTETSEGAGVSSNLKGYCMGGRNSQFVYSIEIEGLTFSTEASAVITATLDADKSKGTGVSSNLKGYIMGGTQASETAVIEDLTFSTEASVVITATLNTAKYGGAGVSSNLKGYCMGGYTGSYLAVIEDLNFSAETSVPITATLDTAKRLGTGIQGYN